VASGYLHVAILLRDKVWRCGMDWWVTRLVWMVDEIRDKDVGFGMGVIG
jgi:hypothetical protein